MKTSNHIYFRYVRQIVKQSNLLSHNRGLTKLISVGPLLALVILMTSIASPHIGQAAFPGTNGMIAFDTNRDNNEDIYVMNADGTNPTRLTNASASDHGAVWSPDGTMIAFHSSRDGNFEIYVMNADGSAQTRLTNDPAIDNSAAWSPDGTKIAFTSSRDGNPEVYVMDANGDNETRITNNGADDGKPTWSPDGTKIAFQSNRDGDFEIYLMNTDGSGLAQLTDNTTRDEGANWSPDGTRIAFTSDRDGNFENYIMNADGTGQVNLTNNPAFDDWPKWSPDGTKIVFRSQRDNNSEIYVMNADGSGQINITNNSAEDVRPDWQRINTPPTAEAGGPYTVEEGGSVQLDASGTTDTEQTDNNTLTYEWDFDGDNQFDDATGIDPTFSAVGLDGPNTIMVQLQVTDDGGLSDTDTATIDITNVAPTVDTITVPLDPVNINDQSSFTADVTFNDPGGANDEPYTCDFDFDNDSVNDATVNGVTNTSCSEPLGYSEPGIFTIKATVTDKDGDSGSAMATQFVVVYDPSGGFVTGGGWIDSPQGACQFESCTNDTTGKATFGFVSKYKKGANVPIGQTQFQFKAGDLNFHSDVYDWLVVAGPHAKFKGTGTINGSGNYGFMVTATDSDVNGGGDTDGFRIKLWDKDNDDVVVYDNKMDAPEDSDDTTDLGGGSIVIHQAK